MHERGILYKQWLVPVAYFSRKRPWCPSGQFSENISGQRSKESDRHDYGRNRETNRAEKVKDTMQEVRAAAGMTAARTVEAEWTENR